MSSGELIKDNPRESFSGFLNETNINRMEKSIIDLSAWISMTIEKYNYYEIIKTKDGLKKHITVAGWSHIDKILGIVSYTDKITRIDIQRQNKRTKPAIPVEYHTYCELRSKNGNILCRQVGIANNTDPYKEGFTHAQVASLSGSRAVSKVHRILFADVLLLTEYEELGYEEVAEIQNSEELEKLNKATEEAKKEEKAPKQKDDKIITVETNTDKLYKNIDRLINAFTKKKKEKPTIGDLRALVIQSGISQKQKELFRQMINDGTIQLQYSDKLKEIKNE